MRIHANARLTPARRLEPAELIVDHGWQVTTAAHTFRVSRQTAAKWARRYSDEGRDGMADRSSRPRTSPMRTTRARTRLITALRRLGMTHQQISEVSGVAERTCGRTCVREGLRSRTPREVRPANRYERRHPGELIHLDVKKLVRIERPGHRFHEDRRTKVADAYLRQLGLTPETADQHLTMDPHALVEAFSPSMEQPGIAGFNVRATIDGTLFTSTGLDAARAGLLNGMRVLIGNNHDEYQLFEPEGPLTQDPGIEQMDYVSRPKMAADVNARYRALRPGMTDHEPWFRIMCEEEWWIPNVRFVEAPHEGGRSNDIWMYRFDFDPVNSPAKLGACHTMELSFVFDTLSSQSGQVMVGDSPGAPQMADRMHAAWVRFIKGDAPGVGAIPEWPRYGLKGREAMILDNECRIEKDPWGDLREAWTGAQ